MENKIFIKNKNKKLLITPIKENYENFNIFNRVFGDKKISKRYFKFQNLFDTRA